MQNSPRRMNFQLSVLSRLESRAEATIFFPFSFVFSFQFSLFIYSFTSTLPVFVSFLCASLSFSPLRWSSYTISHSSAHTTAVAASRTSSHIRPIACFIRLWSACSVCLSSVCVARISYAAFSCYCSLWRTNADKQIRVQQQYWQS